VPQAKIVHDKFHVSKHLNEAVDKVRRRENNALQAEGDDRLKGARQLFLFNPENLPKDRVADFEALKNSDLKAARAWAIKESFRTFWQCKTFKEAQGVFKKWFLRGFPWDFLQAETAGWSSSLPQKKRMRIL